jgi:hypothetical protein
MTFETWEQLMSRARKFFVSYFASQPSVLVVSSLLMVGEHEHERRAIRDGLCRKLFRIVLMAASFLTISVTVYF